MEYIYGPVSSWRLGSSLGIDLLSQRHRICTFDCIYCQLGKGPHYEIERKVYVPTRNIIKELEMLSLTQREVLPQIDYVTLSGRGEPTLAENLGEVIKAIKAIRKEPVAVLTNASLIIKDKIRAELSLADFVSVKLDASSEESFELLNKPAPGIKFAESIDGIKQFRKEYGGRFGLQLMFIAQNKDNAPGLAELAFEINPAEVQINTPLRPCPTKPLSKEEISVIKGYFKGLNVVSVYDAKHKDVKPINLEDTLKRRGTGKW
ncbi:MAG: radical SAM protein [bacterium]|nr:radical SAM protein [bacterium]